jgi:GYF domain 2
MNEYYLYLDDMQKGPFTLSQLQSMWRSGAITSRTLYWQDGFSEWLPLSSILDELEPSRAPIPASSHYPAPQHHVAHAVPEPPPARAARHTRATVQQTSKTIKFFMLVFGLGFWLSLIGCFTLSEGAQALSILSTLLCLVAFIVTKWIRWWFHG